MERRRPRYLLNMAPARNAAAAGEATISMRQSASSSRAASSPGSAGMISARTQSETTSPPSAVASKR